RGRGRTLPRGGEVEIPEPPATPPYTEACPRQAGLATKVLAMEAIGRRPNGTFVDLENEPIELMFKLYPWEWMMREQFGSGLAGAPTQWVEPPWKAILSNKGILPLLWAMFPRHPNLLPAYFDDDAPAAALGRSYARKPLYSREGANVALIADGAAVDTDAGPYGAEGFVRQALAELPRFNGNYTVLGSWIAAGKPGRLSVPADAGAVTKNASGFLPHAIVG